jgi:hypothetical protein
VIRRRRAFTITLIGLVAAAPVAAQRSTAARRRDEAPPSTPGWLLPDRALFPDLLADPRDPVTKGQLAYADPDPTLYGPGLSGDVAIAGLLPLLRLWSREQRALLLGVEGAAFASFSLEVVTRELVNTDWVFAVPLVYRHGDHWVRLRYYHTSSHLGDEYQRRFGPSSMNFSRDGVDLVLYLRPGAPTLSRIGLGVYGGGLFSPNSHPEDGTVWRARLGAEADPGRGRPWTPFAAADFEREDGNPHGWRTTAQVGLWLLPVGGRPVRLAVELGAGPSPMGQFTRRETRRIAFGLYWDP